MVFEFNAREAMHINRYLETLEEKEKENELVETNKMDGYETDSPEAHFKLVQ